MEQTEKILIKKTDFKDLNKIITFEKENSQFVQQYDIAEHKEILENECHLSIFKKGNNKLIGHIILNGISDHKKSIEFRRIVISEKGFGYGKDSIELIKKICFEKYNANRIWLDVYSDNKRAIQLYESLGFLKEKVVQIGKESNLRGLWIMSIDNNI
ncbi:GNAT family N-acetyltransferase [Polaribacter sp. HL-MS24]|uniref:GNAT family N-acetyltransferase n=1 Tax=Polaribacter sp. HL-MS24 TaxID=3077735 RepID=UPI0029344931|nr:GNAT family N-acetyltransferase [Polaribacter sp. HL-MS24]WOC39948.1 GNAT family N-acetyltransferase [Polaribacter sp. HL-MS24]